MRMTVFNPEIFNVDCFFMLYLEFYQFGHQGEKYK